MAISTSCPHCRKQGSVPETAGGQTIICPHCQGEFIVDTIGNSRALPPPIPPATHLNRPGPASPPELVLPGSKDHRVEPPELPMGGPFPSRRRFHLAAIAGMVVLGVIVAALFFRSRQ